MDELTNTKTIVKISASSPIVKDGAFRIVATRVNGKNKQYFHVEKFVGKQAFQQNVEDGELAEFVKENIDGKFKQVVVLTDTETVTYLSNGKGNVKRLSQKLTNGAKTAQTTANRQKNYLLKEGYPVEPLVDLGVFTKEYKVVNSMYDKYKQINRFVEILDDKFADQTQPLTILDFGCGKSYLTFIVYYYFTEVLKRDVRIVGYDLKADVVNNCNKLAEKYGYKNLSFIIADVSKDKLFDGNVDAVICLHACDTATDYALEFAVRHNASFIFAVPCCQHEINRDIHSGGDLDLLLKYGILKERTSALLTDGIRATILEDCGYSVDVMEFVDLAHSPKNLMIRAEKVRKANFVRKTEIANLMNKYGFKQTLFDLIYNKD